MNFGYREILQKLQLALIYIGTQQANQVNIDRRRERECVVDEQKELVND